MQISKNAISCLNILYRNAMTNYYVNAILYAAVAC